MSETANLQTSNRVRQRILLVLILLAIVFSLIGLIGSRDWASFALNLGTEFGGAVITFLLINQVLGRSEQREAEAQKQIEEVAKLQQAAQQEKQDWLNKLKSQANNVAFAAADEIRRRGWMIDGSLEGLELRGANLEGANFADAKMCGVKLFRAVMNNVNLRGADLSNGDLSGAWLHGARIESTNLAGANLWQARLHQTDMRNSNFERANMNETRMPKANLRGANLHMTNLNNAKLQGANLRNTNLTQADLSDAQLQGADLRDAMLTGAILDDTAFDTMTILPDGAFWTAQINLKIYTGE